MARKGLKEEAGAIMLEVIAVLSLMGLMGTVLYRQIYLRNQELHNIQMASEIRVIKDAFAAWLQANATSIAAHCIIDPDNAQEAITCQGDEYLQENMADSVASFLPEGYFYASGSDHPGAYLEANYVFKVFGYIRGDSGHPMATYYGVVIPKPAVLPDGGNGDSWNFRRAARVAMLIGIDGGAYGRNITTEASEEVVAGAVGTWSLRAEDVLDAPFPIRKDCEEEGGGGPIWCPTYVAITGLDVFQPETEAPTVDVNLDTEWSLALKNAGVYGQFVAGGDFTPQRGKCYEITHNSALNGAPVGSDSIYTPGVAPGTNCKPAFYVESGADATSGEASGNVRVYNDSDPNHEPGLLLNKEGIIHQKDGMTIDKDGRILAKLEDAVKHPIGGELKQDELFIVDPAYTSTMNDIRLVSRGGARLSDIIPNYILKEQMEISSSTLATGKTYTTISKPTCPSGYESALAIFPTSWDKKGLNVDIKDKDVADALKLDGTTIKADDDDHYTSARVQNDTGLCVLVNATLKATAESADTWNITLGKRNENNCTYDDKARAIAQTYCLWKPGLYTDKTSCESNGYSWTGTSCNTAEIPAENEDRCTKAGFTWKVANGTIPAHCEYRYNVDNINAILTTDRHLAQRICLLAKFQWDGTTNRCVCPSGKSGPNCK